MEINDKTLQIIGIIAGILTSSALLPQVVKLYKEKKSEQLSMLYLITLMTGQATWILYGILKSDIPVVGTNMFSILVSITTTILSFKYRKPGK